MSVRAHTHRVPHGAVVVLWRRLRHVSPVLLAACTARPGAAPETVLPAPVVLDAFDDARAWEAVPATGVQMRLSNDAGVSGTALRVDFDFRGGGGWAALRRALPVQLPENYELSFWLRGDAPDNTLEVKLSDASGENVWWINRPGFTFRGDWRRIAFRRRHVEFAWGPAGGGEIRDVAALEFAVTAGSGGSGTIWIDSLTLTPLEPVRHYDLTPRVTASATAAGSAPARVLDADGVWRSGAGGTQTLTLDFQRVREYGGIIVHWDSAARALDYDVEVSSDGATWQTVRRVRGGAGARDYLQLPETESRALQLRLLRGPAGDYALRHVAVQPLAWGESPNTLFETIAADAPRGHYPKYFNRVQSYWTLVGTNGGADEALINEEGAVETGRRAFSMEPFLHDGRRLISWADATITQSLAGGYLPIPSVHRQSGALRLDVTAWADGAADAAMLWLRYRVHNTGTAPAQPTLYLALRPFQVNPSWQFLNNPGGVARIERIAYDGVHVAVDGRRVTPVTRPAAFGATTFDAGGVIRALAAGTLPAPQEVIDETGFASAALAYPLTLAAGAARDVIIAVPLGAGASPVGANQTADSALAAARLHETERQWRAELDRFAVELPAHAPPLGDMLRANLAWVLINRDGPAIQPGSRSYERSWIRDGSLTSAALLRLGHDDAVRAFAEWFAPYQYENGKVPCCVDWRGADPVPEHDSHGQLIFLIAEYTRFTDDTTFAARMWPHVERAVAHIDSLRGTRMTAEYRTPELRAYYGLVPQSISHEGYSAKPMHSYWDDFFVLKGLKDAAWLAARLGRTTDHTRMQARADAFRRDLIASFQATLQLHGIDYLPGAVELGDFDATSTTVGITPAGEAHNLPQAALRRTFEKYWENFVARRDGTTEWDAYTPYELRTVGTFVHLGDRRRAHELLRWFMRAVRPPAWHHWAEVVARDPAEPRFIGDMPHGWVGSDFIRSVTDMFVHEREADSTLVIGAGVLPEWLTPGDSVRVRGLRTPHGTVGYTMRAAGHEVHITFAPGVRPPPGGIVVRSPLAAPLRGARADGRAVTVTPTEVRLRAWPRTLVLQYPQP